MISIVLGGAPSVWNELRDAERLLEGRHYTVVAANLAGIHYEGRLSAWCSNHGNLMVGWANARAGNQDYRSFIAEPHWTSPEAEVVADRWGGSSGFYAAQVALFNLGASGVVLCGVPMEQSAGHFCNPGPWATTSDYRRAFKTALPEIGGRVRSMGGWSADLFGVPSAAWVDALINQRPLGATHPQHQTRIDMHTVKNVSKDRKTFKATSAEGELMTVSLDAGESGAFEINPHQAAFQTGELEIAPSRAAPKSAAEIEKASATKG